MVALMMLNSTKNQTIWYGAKMPRTTLRIKPVVVYIVSSASMSACGMCKVSMSNFTFPRMTRIKQKWMSIWKQNFEKWIYKLDWSIKKSLCQLLNYPCCCDEEGENRSWTWRMSKCQKWVRGESYTNNCNISSCCIQNSFSAESTGLVFPF